VKMTCLTITVD